MQMIADKLIQLHIVGAIGLGVDHELGHRDRRRASLGPQLIERGGFGANAARRGRRWGW